MEHFMPRKKGLDRKTEAHSTPKETKVRLAFVVLRKKVAIALQYKYHLYFFCLVSIIFT